MSAPGTRILVPGTLGPLLDGAQALLAQRGYAAVCLGDITQADIDEGFARIDNDLCVATAAVVGQCLRWLFAHEREREGLAVLAPELCRDCRSLSTPGVLSRALGHAGFADVEVVPFSSAEAASAAPPAPQAPARPACPQPVIGVCGNLPVLTTPEFRRTVCDHLRRCGCEVVLPPAQRIADRRDFLGASLEWFRATGVGTAICILPFGCLGGHAFARGRLRDLQARYPEIEVTVLDYDPSASDVNLVNRVELVVQAAREKR